jgi:poly-gamma-glutamate capsule biosynthesis protein CapA/YwtB (metallophosphatase superfamily)
VDSVRLALVGDNVAIDHPEGLGSFYSEVKEGLDEADIRFGNIEWPMTDIEDYDPTRFGRSMRRMAPKEVAGLVEAGFDVVSVANNHMMDWGAGGLLQTLSVMDGAGLKHCGGGTTAKYARQPAIEEVDGIRVGFLAYTAVFVYQTYPASPRSDEPQLATLDVVTSYAPHQRLVDMPGAPPRIVTQADAGQLDSICDDIRRLRDDVDHVVVSWHWGVSWGAQGSSRFINQRADYQEQVGHACVDAGASVVVGHHPHVLQGVEIYRGKPIFYSLGNFVFWYPPRIKPHHDDRSSVALITLGKASVADVTLRAVVIDPDDRKPRFVAGDEGDRVAQWLMDCSADLASLLSYDRITGTVRVEI